MVGARLLVLLCFALLWLEEWGKEKGKGGGAGLGFESSFGLDSGTPYFARGGGWAVGLRVFVGFWYGTLPEGPIYGGLLMFVVVGDM